MGKHQRRKDNSQAASSSKAAQLMHASGVGIPFIGPESSGLGLLNFDEGTISENVNLAPEFRILLKKLTKRDSLTREKAVKEFVDLLKSASSDQLRLTFEYFAPIYQRLVADANAAIRSASNKLLGECISTLKKEAPSQCLKQTLPFLLFSSADHSAQVVKSANLLLVECFGPEKKELVFKNFADDALSLSLNIANRRHRLVFPQQFTDEESNEQRKGRLIAQSFNCIGKLSSFSSDLPSLLSSVANTLTNSESLNPLLALGNNVKVSLFRLAKQIAQSDPNLLIGRGKFVSVLLNNLDLSDPSLFQHAFECFLLLAREDALFEQCFLDKAIVPKLLSLTRKKEGHWDLFASALLPAFSIIFERIGPPDYKKQLKFALAVLDSFFDGAVLRISISSWSNSFVEICKFCFVKIFLDTELQSEENESEFLTEYFHRVKRFVDFVVGDFPTKEYAMVAEFIGWIQNKMIVAKMKHPTAIAFGLELYFNLEDHLLALLPKSDVLLVKLIDILYESERLSLKLLHSSNSAVISNLLLIKSVNSILSSEVNSSKFDNLLLDIVTLRIKIGCDLFGFDPEIVRLIHILCHILMKAGNGWCSLVGRIELDNIWICFHSVGFVLTEFRDLLDHNSLFAAFCTIFRNFNRLESEFERAECNLELVLAYICQNCSYSEREHLLRILPNEAPLILQIPKTMNFVFDYLIRRENISVQFQHFFIESLFKDLFQISPESVDNASAFLFLRQFDCDIQNIRKLLLLFLSSESCTILRIKMVSNACNAIVRFKNLTVSEVFSPSHSDLLKMARKMDSLFSAEILSYAEEGLFTAFSLLRANSSIRLGVNSAQNPFDCLLEFAKIALFYCQFLHNSPETVERGGTAFCYTFVVSTFVDHYKVHTTKSKEFQILSYFSKEFDFLRQMHPMPSLDEIVKCFFASFESENESCLPFCAFYSLLNFAVVNDSSQGISIDRSPIQKIFRIAIQLRLKANCDLDLVLALLPNESGISAETFAVLRWLAEFEWRCANFTEENRAEHFVALATFIEEHRNGVEDWLFTTPKDNLLRSLFGCVLMKFCAKIVPFIAEIGGPIRDFVNCALITALQNSSEFFVSFDQKDAFDDEGLARHWHSLMGHFAMILAIRYENCLRMNRANNDYCDIEREWSDFFGPSVANYVLHWFLQLFCIGKKSKMPPQFCIKTLCNAIQSIEIDRLIKAELPVEFVQRATDQCYYDNTFGIDQIFEGYSNEKRSKLAPAAVLCFNSKPEVQFAASIILKGFLFEMFSSENTACGAFDESSSNGEEFEGQCTERETADIAQTLAKQSHQLKLPRFFKAVLCLDFVPLSHSNDSEVDPSLLCWDVLMLFFGDLDVLSRVRFCDAIDVETLSNSLVHLLNSLSELPRAKGPSGVSHRSDELFTGPFPRKLLDRSFDPEHFACNLFFRTLAIIPALFREWYGTLGKTEANTVAQYTQNYVSNLMIRRELRSLENMKRGRLEIRILPKVREIECTYRLEETAMNLTILLPENYPIGAPKVEMGRCIVSKELHRKWLLQLGVFLNGQNGAMLDGILQWKRSIDQHLKGVEECTICMSTVSSTNYQLPKIRCRQCRKKFHGDCLYKWFQSSSKSSCPLCRANFV